MDLKELKSYLSSKKEAIASYPFDETTLVYKVAGKMFALIAEDNNPLSINLKCDPEDAQILRGMHKSILPGYHMNKEHWNTIILDGSLPDKLIEEMVNDSYTLIVNKLKAADRNRLLK